jgi:ornithine cyclodeaminase
MKLRLLSGADIAVALPMSRCIEVMKRAFADYSKGHAKAPLRTVIPIERDGRRLGTVLVKPAYIPGSGPGSDAGSGLGAKLVSVFPGNAAIARPVTSGLVVLLSVETGEPIAVLDGTFLTAWRTGAASGAATDLLAAADGVVGAVFGAGQQGRTQIIAIDAVRDLEEVRVYARDTERVETLIDELQTQVRARLVAAESPSAAVADAQIVCAATTSAHPVFDGLHVAEGAHVNGVGSFTPEMQEIDLETVLRSRVFVDSFESASVEPGDLIEAVAAGVTNPEEWTELGTVVEGEHPGRQPGDDLTFFKSVGLAVQDIAAGAVVFERAMELELGYDVDL